MCEYTVTCDYPADPKEAEAWLDGSRAALQKLLKEAMGNEQKFVDAIADGVKNSSHFPKICPTCAVKNFVSSLLNFERGREQKQQTVEADRTKPDLFGYLVVWGLRAVAVTAVVQHAEAISKDAFNKMTDDATESQVWSFPYWATQRARRVEFKQPHDLTEQEREAMLALRSKGGLSLRDLSFVFDRNLATVQTVCRGIEPE